MVELTIADIITMMEAGELSAKSLVAMYLENIEQIDRSGPALNSVMEINPEAIEIAEALEKEVGAVKALQHRGIRAVERYLKR